MKIVRRSMMFTVFSLILCGCCGNLYFGTSTSAGLNVSGTTKIPNKISFTFDREEIAIVPPDSSGLPHSVFASLDSEWTWTNGFYVKQNFATGKAADVVTTEPFVAVTYTPPAGAKAGKPLVFTTGTKLGIDIEFGQTGSAPMSLLVGYRRAEMTLMPGVEGKATIDPVLADISIVSTESDSTKITEAPLIGGVRIKQRFATGIAAINASANPDVGYQLRKSVYGDPTLIALITAKNHFDKEGAILAKFSKMDSVKQEAYIKTLNEAFGKVAPNLITADNLQNELGKMNDAQIDVASQQIKPL